MTLCIVTATTNWTRARPCIESWGLDDYEIIVVCNGGTTGQDHGVNNRITWLTTPDYLGSVPAFRLGVDYALGQSKSDVIACFHDDLLLQDPDWGRKVLRRFHDQPAIGLLGFGGAIELGAHDMYETPYQPMSLARHGFRSNLQDAEVHGLRSLLPERVACLDGFSQIGRRALWAGLSRKDEGDNTPSRQVKYQRPWTVLHELGFVHHFYDGALGCLAARYGWETWYLPIRCQHFGGQTAVGDEGYQRWAQRQHPQGDQGFWQDAHRHGYDAFKDVLPLRV